MEVPAFADIDDAALEFFRENGVLVFTDDAVSPEMLEAARSHVEAGAPHGCSCAQEVFDLFYGTKLYGFVTKLLGEDPAPDFRGWAQVASVGPEQADIPDHPLELEVGQHVDFGHAHKPCCHEPGGTHLDRFSMLLGVPFTAQPEDYMGNFGVFAGSHLKVAELFEQRGYDGMFVREDKFNDPSHPEYPGAKFKHAFWRASQPSCNWGWMDNPGEPVALKLELGQAYIAHFNTLHWVQKNLRLTEPRNVVYFRIQHPRAHHEYDQGAFANLWKDYPCFGGSWAMEGPSESDTKWADDAFQIRGLQEDYDRVMLVESSDREVEYAMIKSEVDA